MFHGGGWIDGGGQSARLRSPAYAPSRVLYRKKAENNFFAPHFFTLARPSSPRATSVSKLGFEIIRKCNPLGEQREDENLRCSK